MSSKDACHNWFTPNRVVKGDDFFGRDNELYQLRQRLRSGQSVIIVGERRIGKSSLLAEGYRRLADSDPEYHLLLDAQMFTTGGRLMASLTSYLKNRAPRSLQTEHQAVDTDSLVQAMNRAAGSNHRLTVFLNDLDDLDDLLARSPEVDDGRHLVSFLRSVIENGHLIVCAVAFHAIFVEPPTSMHAPLFNVFHPINLRSFDEPDAWHLLTTNSKRSGDELTETECHFVMELAGRKPHHLQEFGFGLFESGSFLGSAGRERLNSLEEAANHFSWAISDHWEHTLRNLSTQQRSALISAFREEPMNDPGSYSYLVKRGLLDESTSQFSPMGTLFHRFALELYCDSDREDAKKSINSPMRSVAESALKAAIGAAVKAILS